MYKLEENKIDLVKAIYLGETLTGTFKVTLEPCEVTTGVWIKKVWLWRLAYVEGNVKEPTKIQVLNPNK